ncbi:class I SAM-dependent methyltransferase [Paraburkholderia sediminicola]|uniref:class I SAM-dependent methyltransferase n=1 Tax=Paraburkholderia sediminicola TaxID=458836 RepID=UPI0038BCBE68
MSESMLHTFQAITDRYAAYSERKVSTEISEHEDMFAHGYEDRGAMEHYLKVGRSAIDVIANAMISGEKTDPQKVLDLPCGGGRVTRQLAAFFPEAKLFIGDVNKNKVQAVIETFGAMPIEPGIDFSIPATERFDLIWVGSLFTHLNDWLFERALRWYVNALEADGVLVFTTHGRRHEHMQSLQPHVPPERWAPASASLKSSGFGFVPYNPANAADPLEIGTTVSSPAWVMRLVESDPSLRIIQFHEGGWVDAQDVVAIQKRPV